MKKHLMWRWSLAGADGTVWYGTCPVWASQPLPTGATLTRERVLALGVPTPCRVPGCHDRHVAVPHPVH